MVRGTSMNGEAFAGTILAGYGSWMFLVFLEFSVVILGIAFLIVAVVGVIGVVDDLLNDGRWIRIVFRGRS